MNCKPGDLAIVIRGLTHPSPNLGRVVEVLSRLADHQSLGPVWHCKSRHAMKVRTPRGDELAAQFWVPDAWLRPVSGLPVHDEQLDEVTL
jgi:hypothetical protein